jgi:hypothetical protein
MPSLIDFGLDRRVYLLVGHKHISSDAFQAREELQGIPGGISQAVWTNG